MLKKTLSVLLAVVMLCSMIPLGVTQAFAAETDSYVAGGSETADDGLGDDDIVYSELELGSDTEILFTEEGEREIIRELKPESTKAYDFYSTGDYDTIGELQDSEKNLITSNDDGGENSNFRFTAKLEAGKTYYLRITLYSYTFDDNGEIRFTLHTDELAEAESLTITCNDEDIETYEGYEGSGTTFYYVVSPQNTYSETVEWSSSDDDIVGVEPNDYYSRCNIRLKSPGTAVVTATYPNGVADSVQVTVLEAQTITPGETKTVNTGSSNKEVRFKFTAPESRYYAFYSTGDNKTRGVLYSSDGQELDANSGNGTDPNFRIQFKFTEGETYYLSTNHYYSDSSDPYPLTLEAIPFAEAVEITGGETVTGYPGNRFRLNATLLPEGSAAEYIRWTTSDSDVAGVSSYYGDLYFNSPGKATITATSDRGLTDTIEAVVKDFEPIALDTPADVTAKGFDGATVFRFVPAETAVYEFTSSGAQNYTRLQIGTISDDGYMSSVNGTYGSNDFSMRYKLEKDKAYYFKAGFDSSSSEGSYQFTVSKVAAATSMEIAQGESISGKVWDNIDLQAVFLPKGSAEESVTWTSSDSDVAYVGYNGRIELRSVGEATITAVSENGLTAEILVTVTDVEEITAGETKSVEINAPGTYATYRFIPDETCYYSFYSTGEYDTYGTLYDSTMYSLENDDQSGGGDNFRIRCMLIEGETYYIRPMFYSSSETGSFDFTCVKNPQANLMKITQGETFTGHPGENTRFGVTFYPENAMEEDVDWSSSDPDTVSVSYDGIVSYKKIGSATITAESENGLEASCVVTVSDFEEIKLDESKPVKLDSTTDHVMFKFVPTETREYTYESLGDASPYGRIYDEDMNTLTSGSWNGDGGGFKLKYTLEAGETYYMYAEMYYGTDGEFDLLVSYTPFADSISIYGDSFSGIVGGTLVFYAEFEPEDSYEEDVSWSSSDESVATVNDSGRVTLLSKGTADITASTSSGLSDTATVTVTGFDMIDQGDTKTVEITNPNERVFYKFKCQQDGQYVIYSDNEGERAGLYCAVFDTDMSRLLYQTTGSSKLEITRRFYAGKSYFVECGYSTDNAVGQYDITLIKCPEATALSVTPEAVSGYPNNEIYLQTIFLPKYAETQNVTFESSDPEVATVDGYGSVTLKKIGTATITAVSEKGLTATVPVTVKDYDTIAVGETKPAEISYSGGCAMYRFTPAESGAYAFWSNSDDDTYGTLLDSDMNLIKSDDSSGRFNNFKIEALLTGGQTYYISASKWSSSTGSFTVSADSVPLAESMTFTKGSQINAYLNRAVWLDVKFSPDNCYQENVSWSVSGSDTATVDDYGYVTLTEEGTVTVTATSESGLTAQCTVTSIDYDTLAVGETKTAQFAYSGATVVYRVVPEEDCYAHFYLNHDNNYDACSMLMDEQFDTIKWSDPGSAEIKNKLQKGKTYYYEVVSEKNKATSFDVSLEAIPFPTGLEIINLPDRTEYVEGYADSSYIDYNGMVVRTKWSDGQTVDWEYDDDDTSIRGEHVLTSRRGKTITVSCADQSDSFEITTVPNPVQSIEVVNGIQATITENTHGYWYNQYNPETGNYDLKVYRYNIPDTDGAVMLVNFTDGTSETVSVKDKVAGYRFQISDDQYSTPWTVGENPITVSLLGKTATLYATVTESPVSGLEIIGTPDPVFEHTNGEWDTRYNQDTGKEEDFYYYHSYGMNGIKVRIHYKDGTYRDAEIGDYVDGAWISTVTSQYDKPFTLGSDNEVTVTYMGAQTTAYATITENPVSSIEVLNGFTLTVIEDVDGYINTDEDGNEYFTYSYSGVRNADILINYKDGSQKIAHPYDLVDGDQYIGVYSDQDRHRWTVGGNNKVTISYLDCEATITAQVVPNPIESLTVVKPSSKVFIENSDGYYDEYNDEEFYYYYVYGLEDAVIGINRTDGTTQTANLNDFVDGYRISYENDQYRNHWTVGGNNSITVTYMGRSVEMPVTLTGTPLSGLVINSVPTRTYIFGDPIYGTGDNFVPSDITGLSFTAKFKNGTTKTYSYTDADENDRFGGYGYTITNSGKQKVGNNLVTFSFMGAEATYTVPVAENTTASLEVVALPTNCEYSDYYDPDWRGMKVKLTKTNNSTVTATVSDSNIIYGFDDRFGPYIGFDLDGNEARIIRGYEEDQRVFYVEYLGKRAKINGMTRREDKEVVGVSVENFSPSAQNMIVNITNEDGSTEQLILDNIVFNQRTWSPEFTYAMALTPKGLLPFYIFNHEVNPNNPYLLEIFRIEVKKDADPTPDNPYKIVGDANGDGTVDILDAAVIQKYSAGKATLTPQQIKAADVNNDNTVDILDATQVQKFAAGKITGFKRKTTD